MKQYIHFFLFLIAAAAKSQTLELELSDPQPRLGDTVDIIMHTLPLKTDIMKLINGEGNIVPISIYDDRGDFKYKLGASKIGTHVIEPKTIKWNEQTYTTTRLVYEVMDSLPKTNSGIWIRKVDLSDSTFCIIIDQRIPYHVKNYSNGDNWQ